MCMHGIEDGTGRSQVTLIVKTINVMQERIIGIGHEWVVLDKPAGVPAVPTVDNIIENCVKCVQKLRGRCQIDVQP